MHTLIYKKVLRKFPTYKLKQKKAKKLKINITLPES